MEMINKNYFKWMLCLFFSAAFIMSGLYLNAVPAYPGLIYFSQPDGAVVPIRLSGDEFIHRAHTPDGYALMFNKIGAYEYAKLDENKNLVPSGIIARNSTERTLVEKLFLLQTSKNIDFSQEQIQDLQRIKAMFNSATVQSSFPTNGSSNILCILMGYKDRAFQKTRNDFYNLFNQVGYSVDGATGSVKDFYTENSHGKFNLNITVAGPYTSANNMSYYGANSSSGNDSNPQVLIQEAVRKADADVDFSDFDNDGDGAVDGIHVIFAGYGEDAGGGADAIWSHAWSFSAINLDGVWVDRYSCSPELRNNYGSGITRIGVVCHEIGHVMGAPDYYDTDYTTGGDFIGTGCWDLMAQGSWNNDGATPAHHNAYTKTKLYNWGTAQVINSPITLSLTDVVANNTNFYQINTTTSDEYFLVENRQKKGFDAYLPGHGMIIYHVHKEVSDTWENKLNATYPQRMYPVCASATGNPGSSPSSYGAINSSGCSFPGSNNVKSFTDNTFPGSISWAGANTNKPITNIVESGGIVTFDFMGGGSTNIDTQPPSKPSNVTYTNLTTTQVDLKWTASTDNAGVVGYDIVSGTLKQSTITNSATITGLQEDTQYSFVILAKDAAGNYSIDSDPITFKTPKNPIGTDTQAPSVPTNISFSNLTTTQVDLNWTASTDNVGVTGYDIISGTWNQSTTTTSVTIKDLQADAQYSFTIRAKDAAGNYSVDSKAIVFVTPSTDTPGASELKDGIQVTNSLDLDNVSDLWYIDMPNDVTSMRVILTCGSNDFDLYGSFKRIPTTRDHEWLGYESGGEDVVVNKPSTGRHYILVHRYEGDGAYQLTAYLTRSSYALEGIQELSFTKENKVEKIEFACYPNPGNGFVNLLFKDANSIKNISIVNSVGKMIYSKTNFKGDNLMVTDLSPGVYILTISEDDNKKFVTQKLIVR